MHFIIKLIFADVGARNHRRLCAIYYGKTPGFEVSSYNKITKQKFKNNYEFVSIILDNSWPLGPLDATSGSSIHKIRVRILSTSIRWYKIIVTTFNLHIIMLHFLYVRSYVFSGKVRGDCCNGTSAWQAWSVASRGAQCF